MARTPTKRTPAQDAILEDLADASRRLDEAQAAYKAAFLAADAGRITQTAIAGTLGVSVESVRRWLVRNREDEVTR